MNKAKKTMAQKVIGAEASELRLFFFCPPNEFWPLGWTTSLDSESEQKHPFTNHRSPDNMS